MVGANGVDAVQVAPGYCGSGRAGQGEGVAWAGQADDFVSQRAGAVLHAQRVVGERIAQGDLHCLRSQGAAGASGDDRGIDARRTECEAELLARLRVQGDEALDAGGAVDIGQQLVARHLQRLRRAGQASDKVAPCSGVDRHCQRARIEQLAQCGLHLDRSGGLVDAAGDAALEQRGIAVFEQQAVYVGLLAALERAATHVDGALALHHPDEARLVVQRATEQHPIERIGKRLGLAHVASRFQDGLLGSHQGTPQVGRQGVAGGGGLGQAGRHQACIEEVGSDQPGARAARVDDQFQVSRRQAGAAEAQSERLTGGAGQAQLLGGAGGGAHRADAGVRHQGQRNCAAIEAANPVQRRKRQAVAAGAARGNVRHHGIGIAGDLTQRSLDCGGGRGAIHTAAGGRCHHDGGLVGVTCGRAQGEALPGQGIERQVLHLAAGQAHACAARAERQDAGGPQAADLVALRERIVEHVDRRHVGADGAQRSLDGLGRGRGVDRARSGPDERDVGAGAQCRDQAEALAGGARQLH